MRTKAVQDQIEKYQGKVVLGFFVLLVTLYIAGRAGYDMFHSRDARDVVVNSVFGCLAIAGGMYFGQYIGSVFRVITELEEKNPLPEDKK